jgi:zinc/manganese transport system substrate-binding protein
MVCVMPLPRPLPNLLVQSGPARRQRPLAVALVVGCAGLLVGVCACSSTSSSAPVVAGTKARTLRIVAGENFWGSIVAQLAGRVGQVTSVVSDPNADPHSYQSSSDNARAFADADYVVLNGAGYDSWADRLIKGNPSSKRKVLTVADLLGKKDGDNPHFWYDPDAVTKVADRITADLKALDPSDAGYFDAQHTAFDNASAPYRAQLAAIKAKFAGTPVASTESIFVYLADYLGLKVVSPTEFMQAVAEGNDPPAPSVAAFMDLMSKKEAKVLVYNRQTSTEVTTNLRKLATKEGIPVVGVTETIQPPQRSFEDWFGAELADLQNALNAGAALPSTSTSTSPTSPPARS